MRDNRATDHTPTLCRSRKTILSTFVTTLLAMLLLCGCATRQDRILNDLQSRTGTPAMKLDRFLALAPAEQAERRAEAEPIIRKWQDLDYRIQDFNKHKRHEWKRAEKSNRWGYGVLAGASMLRDAIGLDPTRADLWTALARYSSCLGDHGMLMQSCSMAQRTLEFRPEQEQDSIRRDTALCAAWSCRDQGLFEQALQWLDQRPAGSGRRQESLLLRGLIFAGMGRQMESRQMAQLVGSVEVPIYRNVAAATVDGWSTDPSSYAQNWIDAVAWLRAGYPDLAWRALGVLHKQRPEIPFAAHYWNDVGLVAEMSGRPVEAWSCYGLAAYSLPDREYLPLTGFSCGPLICGNPMREIPVYVGPGDHLMAGSIFAYGAKLVAECGMARDERQRKSLAQRAESALNACILRDILPDLALALRGRLYCYTGEEDKAWNDLLLARAQMREQDRADARTEHLLGVQALRYGYDDPTQYLETAVELDPQLAPAWLALGVCRSKADLDTQAMNAFDRAIALEPDEVNNWYNRGLHHSREHRWELAIADLNRARLIEPERPEVIDLLAQIEEISDFRAAPIAASPSPSPTIRPAADPLFATAEFTPEEVLLETGDLQKLEQSLARTGSPADRLDLGRAYLQTGRAAECRDLLLPLWPDGLTAEERRLLMIVDRDMGSESRAVALATGGISAYPVIVDTEVWTLAALICFENQHIPEGLAALEVALALDPGNTSLQALANLHLGEAGD